MKDPDIKKIKEILYRGKGTDIVLLLGESGSARYTTLKVLCAAEKIDLMTESEVEMLEKENLRLSTNCMHLKFKKADGSLYEQDDDKEIHFSQTQLVDLVFQYANAKGKKAFLLRFLPSVPGFDWFHKILKDNYSQVSLVSSPIFFSLNEELEGVAIFKKKLMDIADEFRLNIHIVRCSSNETNVIKALHKILRNNPQVCRKLPNQFKLDEIVKDIARDTLHNIHLSMASLQMFVNAELRQNKSFATGKRIKQLKHQFGDNIFHKIGKVLYNKRIIDTKFVPPEALKDANKKGNYRYEGDSFDKMKNKFYFKPDEIVESLQSERSAYRFRLGIQNNFLFFSGDIKDCSKIANGITKLEDHLKNFKRYNVHNFEEEAIKLTTQYAYNFMNNSRYPPPPKRGKLCLETFGLKTFITKPIKAKNREIDELMLCPELKILLKSDKRQAPITVPIEILEDISSDSDSEGMSLRDRMKKNQANMKPPNFKEPVVFRAFLNQSITKTSQTTYSSQFPRLDKTTLEVEIGDIVSLSSSSSRIDDSELDLLESNFYKGGANPPLFAESQTRLSNERFIFDEKFDDLDQLITKGPLN